MNTTNTILCPIDLSENSVAAIQLASNLAKARLAILKFMYVAPQWLPEESMSGSDSIRDQVAEDKDRFMKIRASDPSIECQHVFLHGNAGPEIVKASSGADMIVMSTHGYSGIIRFLMGSVAQYVLRNAKCPVVMYRNEKHKIEVKDSQKRNQPYVTEIMRQVAPIHVFDSMAKVLEELSKAGESAAPVIDDSGNCIGILTLADIERYRRLKRRLDEHDETVIDEVFKTDEFGLRRTDNSDFDTVKRHMTAPVVTIRNVETCEQANRLFEANSQIHHLVILDDLNHPVGIAEFEDLIGQEFSKEA